MIGIYALYWEKSDMVYVGQTTKSNRLYQHIRLLEKGSHFNYKCTDQYIKYGNPEYIELEVCSISELNNKEILWIKQFSPSILNLTSGGTSGSGTMSSGSVYSRSTILKILSRLYRTLETYAEISKRLNVGISVVSKIALGTEHIWIQEQYPKHFASIQNNRILRAKNNTPSRHKEKIYPNVIDPYGVTHTITNAKDFCKSNPGLGVEGYSNFSNMLRGGRKQHKGFRLEDPNATTQLTTRPTLYGPNNEEYYNITSIKIFCESNKYLKDIYNANKGLSAVFRGDRPLYRGFTLTRHDTESTQQSY